MKKLRDTLVSLAAFAVLLVSVVWLWQQATGPDETELASGSEVTDLSRSEPESEPIEAPAQAGVMPARETSPQTQDAEMEVTEPATADVEVLAAGPETEEPEEIDEADIEESEAATMEIAETDTVDSAPTLYRWRNEQGRIVVADSAPESKEYETLSKDYFESGNGENGIKRAGSDQRARADEAPSGIVVKGSGLDRSMVSKQPAKCRASLSRLLDLQNVISRSTGTGPSKWCGEYEDRLELLFNRNCPLDYDLLRQESGCDL